MIMILHGPLTRLRWRWRKWRTIVRVFGEARHREHGAWVSPWGRAWFFARCEGWAFAGRHLGQASPHHDRVRRLGLLAALLIALSGCAKTEMSVTYADPGGKQITASYYSTKDIEAPTFSLVRDENGNVQSIQIGAAAALASPVNAQTNELVGRVTEGAVKGALEGARIAVPGPAAFQPSAEELRMEQMIWEANAAGGTAL